MSDPSQSPHSSASSLPGFDHVLRSWDTRHEQYAVKILPGEYYVTITDEMITTVLGSCVSACVRDPDTGVGGMNHFMLPGDNGRQHNKWGGDDCLVTRYGVAAMETLINDILKQGSRKARLELKLFGGGEVLRMETNNVGKRNVEFVRNFVRLEDLAVAAEDLGGPSPRKINYFPKTGKVMMRRLRSLQKSVIVDQERSYASGMSKVESPGEIDLFD